MALFDEEQLGSRLRRAGVLAWSVIGIIVLVYVLFRYVLYPIRGVFPPLVIATVIVYLLDPVVTRLAVRMRSRGWATLVVYLMFVGVVAAIVVNVGPLVSRQVAGFLDDLPDYLQRGARAVNRFADRRGWPLHVTADQREFAEFVQTHRDTVFNVLGRAQAVGASVLHAVVTFVLALLLSFYALVDLPKIRRASSELVPPHRRAEVRQLTDQIGSTLGGFFRGQLLVALFVGVLSAVGLALIRLPFAFLVGLVAGIFNLVPLIGPFIGAVPAVVLGLLSGDPNKAWQAALVLLIVQQLDNHVLSPNVMGRTVNLHPITVMLALIAGAATAGIPGMLLAVPVVATAKILILYGWRHRRRVIAAAETPRG